MKVVSLRQRGPLLEGVLWLGLGGCLIVAVLAGIHLWTDHRTNTLILALEAGEDRPVSADAPAAARIARLMFLTGRDRLEEADALSRSLDGTDPLTALGLYDLANARMRLALEAIEDARFDDGATQVRLAKESYRAALGLVPDLWDAKYNLDVAMRLVRDFPEVDQAAEEDPPPASELLWTELPGLPRGLP